MCGHVEATPEPVQEPEPVEEVLSEPVFEEETKLTHASAVEKLS